MKILLIDCETAPNKVYSWGLFDQNIAINQIVEPGYTLSWAAKWHNKKEIMYGDIQEGKTKFLERIYKLLEEADVVVHYNGNRFDVPVLMAEFVQQGWTPPAPFKNVDLYSTVKRRFKFPSNKLNYVSKALGLGEKTAHRGMDMWKEVMDGNKASWKEMKTYNKQDVVLLEKLYNVLKPWVISPPNQGLFNDSEETVCPSCGSKHLQKRGFHHTQTMTYQKLQCQDCGAWSRLRVTDVDKKKRKSIIVSVS